MKFEAGIASLALATDYADSNAFDKAAKKLIKSCSHPVQGRLVDIGRKPDFLPVSCYGVCLTVVCSECGVVLEEVRTRDLKTPLPEISILGNNKRLKRLFNKVGERLNPRKTHEKKGKGVPARSSATK